ncbi:MULTISPECIES: hypothetical protein [unclassified Chryseobacterium]|uniref:hypothetical protein n=1 Tax=unclassified Chryseobacterium TaxID=2593645 RepID=UPI000F4E400B|nr:MULTISPECIES: hypothetical protein [unclassified Chryseobacterium]
MKKEIKILNKTKMSVICGSRYIQTSTDVRKENGCTTITTDGYYDNNNNGKLDKNETFSSCSQTVCN